MLHPPEEDVKFVSLGSLIPEDRQTVGAVKENRPGMHFNGPGVGDYSFRPKYNRNDV
jgi:hypothetical protein